MPAGKTGTSLLTLPLLILGAAAALTALPPETPGIRVIDRLGFELASRSLPPVRAGGVAVAAAPAGLAPNAALSAIAQALDGVALAAPRGVAVLLDAGTAQAYRWSAPGQALARLLDTRGIPAAGPGLAPTVEVTADSRAPSMPPAGWPQILPLRPMAPPSGSPASLRERRVALVQGSREAPLAGPELVALAALQGAGPIWQRGAGLSVGELRLDTDLAGGVYLPRHPGAVDLRRVDWESLRRGDSPGLQGQLLLLGTASRQTLEATAARLALLADGAAAHTPFWAELGGRAVPLAAALWLLLAVPVLPLGRAALLTSALVLAVAATCLALLAAQQVWLPAGSGLALLLAGFAPVRMWARRRRREHARMREEERLRRSLAAFQIEAGQHLAAFETLAPAPASDPVLEMLYSVGLALERRRNYPAAERVFRRVRRHQRDYRDVAEHLRSLRQVNAHPAGSAAGLTGTLVLDPQALQRATLGRYRLERELGRGAMGTVYLGHDPKIGRRVAIKTLEFAQFDGGELASVRERFAREAEAAGRLSHPNIVTVYDVGEEDELAFIAMDYVAGENLTHFTEADRLQPVEQLLRLLAEVADALDYAHRQGVVHRDIKPGNLIYNAPDDRIKITDFGIARVADSSRTRTGAVLGTPSYMAPEQLTGDPVDGRADVFSLGVTLYQLLVGALPFSGDNLAALAYQIAKTQPTDVRELRPELPASAGRIVARALRKRRDRRYQSAAEMADALRRAGARLADRPGLRETAS